MSLCDAQWKWWAGFCAISLVVGSLKPAQACYRITYGRPCRWPNRECRQFAARHQRRRALAADCSANRSISQSVNTIHFRRCFSMHPRRAVLRPQTAHEGLLTTLATRNCLRCCRHTDTTHTHTLTTCTLYIANILGRNGDTRMPVGWFCADIIDATYSHACTLTFMRFVALAEKFSRNRSHFESGGLEFLFACILSGREATVRIHCYNIDVM